ncbi:hypothetical protein GIB67_019004 [Kingdonia uniflora]|uniref:Partial AB-hydrolase lipase domain-containing protein n=1 Tax=Kingdonia uniflora TaxID=39325 RepID=A0A7J7MZ81_9MAGN|nr:hypothetical protein GIB67_019004 [Kingdonia uniflora]
MTSLVTFLRWLVIVLPVLVLVVDPYVAAYGLSLASFIQRPRGRVLGAPRVGLCKSSILPYGGYECQEHKVKTSDGYILGMQRIQVPGTKANFPYTKIPVILQHGVFLDGQSWFMNVRSQTLPFVLADNGYDVWIANSRGTRYSSHHDYLHPSDWKFWDWSWDELAQYDLPACVNYVYAQTQQKPHYIGHSQGTIIALAAFSEGKVYDKLRSASLLSPVAYLQHMTTLIGRVFARNFLGDLAFSMGLAEFDLQKFQLQHFVRSLCSLNNIDCYDALTILTGSNCCLNSSTIEE